MNYKAKVVKLQKVRKHNNADKLQVGVCCGNQIITDLTPKENDLGVYFPSDGQLTESFCHNNNLFSDQLLNIDTTKKGLFDKNRKIKVIKLRGETSDGFFIPIEVFNNYKDYSKLVLDYEFDSLDKELICKKYINIEKATNGQNLTAPKSAENLMFKRHFSTEHLYPNIKEINPLDLIIVTEKLHGTSHRVSLVKNEKVRVFNWFLEFFFKFIKLDIIDITWDYIHGTRNTILKNSNSSQTIREKAFNLFNNKLHKGETVYMEIVGYEPSGKSIMGTYDNERIDDKDFIKEYGLSTVFSYGCEIGESKVFVYRITTTNEDGITTEYSWKDVEKRCKELEVNTVPVLYYETFGEYENIDRETFENHTKAFCENTINNCSELDVRHIKEGLCFRVEGGKTYKVKSFDFKVLEQKYKETNIDPEEQEENFIVS